LKKNIQNSLEDVADNGFNISDGVLFVGVDVDPKDFTDIEGIQIVRDVSLPRNRTIYFVNKSKEPMFTTHLGDFELDVKDGRIEVTPRYLTIPTDYLNYSVETSDSSAVVVVDFPEKPEESKKKFVLNPEAKPHGVSTNHEVSLVAEDVVSVDSIADSWSDDDFSDGCILPAEDSQAMSDYLLVADLATRHFIKT
jgi:hypothetical protein